MIVAGIGLGALVVSAALGAVVVHLVLRHTRIGNPVPGVLRGGRWIGVLERLSITGAILVGMPEAVAVVVAIKGLGRYPELRDAESAQRAAVSERFIIGSLTSFLWAAAVGVAGSWAMPPGADPPPPGTVLNHVRRDTRCISDNAALSPACRGRRG